MIQSWSSGSSSSGFCSSKESSSEPNSKGIQKNNEGLNSNSNIQKSNGKLNNKDVNVENSNNNVKKLPQNGLKSCDCQEYRAIESMVHPFPINDLKYNKQPQFQQSNYSNIQNVLNKPSNAQIPTKRPPTPPRLSRKAVSFRSSVEHIGSPNCRRLRDPPSTLQSLFQPPLFGYSGENNDNADNDSCDSMHVTKDFSLVDNPNDDDYLLPRDCSTPKVNPENGEQLIQVEVHRPKNGIVQQQKQLQHDKLLNGRRIQDYTCLCSADFNCTHKYVPLSAQQERFIDPNRYRDMTRQQNSQDFILSKDCSDCKNLSTYVNLSRQQIEPNQPSFYWNVNNLSVASSSDVNGAGYNSNEYRQLIKSKQSEVYGQTSMRQRQQNWSTTNSLNEQRVAAATSNQADDYLSVARRLQLSMEDCEMCHRQLEQQSSDMVQCSCLPLENDIIANNSRQSAEIEAGDKSSAQLHNMSSSTTKSFHTASSSLNSIPTLNQSQQQAYINSSELSVLPLNVTTNTSSRRNDYIDLRRLESKAENHGETKVDSRNFEGNIEPPSSNTNSNNNNNNNNIDSSLSSLFVYRHVSHNNTPEVDEGFDPDSLEIKQANCSNSNKSSINNLWLKPKAKNEYIPLSSTNSTISATATTKPKARKQQQQQHASMTGNYLTANKASKAVSNDSSQRVMQLGTDITQSSLAKRRHLANSLQQNGKRKLLLSKSKSTPNVSQLNRSSSSSSSNVKNIYQCVKNHLFDTLTKSSSGNSSSSKQMNGQQLDDNQQRVANNFSNSTLSSSSATLPANLNIASATKLSRTTANKSTLQVCM